MNADQYEFDPAFSGSAFIRVDPWPFRSLVARSDRWTKSMRPRMNTDERGSIRGPFRRILADPHRQFRRQVEPTDDAVPAAGLGMIQGLVGVGDQRGRLARGRGRRG